MTQKSEHQVRGVDHTAFPTFDPAGTVRFYRDVSASRSCTRSAPRAGGRRTTRTSSTSSSTSATTTGSRSSTTSVSSRSTTDRGDVYAGFGPEVPEFFVRSRHLAIHVDDQDDLLEYRRRLDDSSWPVEMQIQHETIESIYTHDPNGYMVEFTRAMRPVTPQEDLDAEPDDRRAASTCVAEPEPTFGKLLTRKAELIVERAAAWEAGSASPRRGRAAHDRALRPRRPGEHAVAKVAGGGGPSVGKVGPYFEITADGPIVVDRRATGCRHAVWYSCIAGVAGSDRAARQGRAAGRPGMTSHRTARGRALRRGGRAPGLHGHERPRADHRRRRDGAWRARDGAGRADRRLPHAPAPGRHPPRPRAPAARARRRRVDPAHAVGEQRPDAGARAGAARRRRRHGVPARAGIRLDRPARTLRRRRRSSPSTSSRPGWRAPTGSRRPRAGGRPRSPTRDADGRRRRVPRSAPGPGAPAARLHRPLGRRRDRPARRGARARRVRPAQRLRRAAHRVVVHRGLPRALPRGSASPGSPASTPGPARTSPDRRGPGRAQAHGCGRGSPSGAGAGDHDGVPHRRRPPHGRPLARPERPALRLALRRPARPHQLRAGRVRPADDAGGVALDVVGPEPNADFVRCAPGVTVPTLFVELTGDQAAFPADATALTKAIGADDVTHVRVAGRHFGAAIADGATSGATLAGNAMAHWLGTRFPSAAYVSM